MVCCTERKHYKLIEDRTCVPVETIKRIGCLLDRVLVLSPVGEELSCSFERPVLRGPVDTNDADTNGTGITAFELFDLAMEIANDSVDLLDHGLRENLGFGANFQRRDRATPNRESWNDDGFDIRNNLAEGAVTATSPHARRAIRSVDYRASLANAIRELRRSIEIEKVLEEK
jgi:hypothetical protein